MVQPLRRRWPKSHPARARLVPPQFYEGGRHLPRPHECRCERFGRWSIPIASVRPQKLRYVPASPSRRSEEHTSELQSLTNLVCRLLLEKKKKTATRST